MNLKSLGKKSSLPAILLILLAGVIVYANTFHVPFILDDHIFIDSKILRNLNNFFSNFSGYHLNPARYIAILSLALNYHFGGHNVVGYHVVNLAIHLLTALLVYGLLRLTFRTPYFHEQFADSSSDLKFFTFRFSLRTLLPLFAALLFVVHPVQTQAVTYIVQRMASLTTLFFLLSITLYAKARLVIENAECSEQNAGYNKQESGESAQQSTGSVQPERGAKSKMKIGLLLAGSVIAAALAMKTKQIAFTLPFAAVLYESCFFRGTVRRRLLYLLPLLATLPIIPMGTLAAITHTGGQSANGILANVGEQLRANTNITRLDYLFTQFRVIVTYLRLLVLPINQNLVYAYPVYHTFFTPPVYLSFSLLAGIFVLAVYLFFASRLSLSPSRRPAAPFLRLIAFGILWFFLTLSVESSIIPIQDVIMEHRLYLPSIGAAIVFSAAFFLLMARLSAKQAGVAILIGGVIIVSLSVATYRRNKVWHSELSLWEDVVSKSPQKPKALNSLGSALNDAGKPWQAIPFLQKAVDLTYNYATAYYNLGRSYILIGQGGRAIPFLRKAISIKPDLTGAYCDLGAALIADKRDAEAIAFLEKNLFRLKDDAAAHFNLGAAYFDTGQLLQARRQLAILKRLDQGFASRLANLMGVRQ